MKPSCSSRAEPARVLRWFIACLAIASNLIPQLTPASGVVTNCTEADLRAALAGGGTVTFGCDGTVSLSSNLVVSSTTWLDADGHHVTLDGGQLTRVLTVPSNMTCTLVGLKVANGRHPTEGAGVFNEGTLTLLRCTFSNNVVSGGTGLTRGGAVLNGGTLEALECTFVTNRIDTGSTYGGALHNTSVLRVDRCAFLHNVATANGGAIANWVTSPGVMHVGITNSTFFGNRAIFNGGGDVYHLSGGTAVGGSLYVVNCTFAGGAGGAIYSMGFPSTPWVANSIVGSCVNCIDGGNNLGWTAAIDPRLGPLTNNGGPTLTMAPMPDSPAVNQGNNAFSPPMDQRGVARPFGPSSDIGAYESTVPPSPAFFQFSEAAVSVNETGGSTTITVTRSGSSAGAASVHYASSDGTALTGSDYSGASGVLSFANGQTNASFVVSIQDDLVPEPNETFQLTLSAPSGGPALGSPVQTTVTILDNDPASPGTLQFSSPTYSVSESDGEALITVTRTGGTNGVVSAEYFVAGGTATASDYIAATGSVVLLDAETRKTFSFRIVPDGVPEGPETVVLGLRNPTGGAAVSSATTTLSIVDANQTLSVCNEVSLRSAVAGGGHVSLACDGTIYLAAPLDVSNGVSIDGSGHNVSISGSNATRLFLVRPGVTLTLRSLALVDGLARGTNGNAGQAGESAQGGAVCNSNGVLNAYDCVFLRNRALGGIGGASAGGFPPVVGAGGAASGGAIYNWLGLLNTSNCVLSANRADGGKGGGIVLDSIPGGEARGGALCNASGVVHVVRSILSSNVAMAGLGNRGGRAPAYGGSVFNVGDANLQESILHGNSVISDALMEAGGGALAHSGLGILSLTDCTVSDNRALGGQGLGIGSPFGLPGRPGLGGGLYVVAGEARLTNTTVAYNLAVGGAGVPSGAGAGRGGGIYSAAAILLHNCTVAANTALGGQGRASPTGDGEGGGLYNAAGGLSTLIHATIASNAASAGANGSPVGASRGGAIASAGGTVSLRSTILASSPSGSNCYGSGFVDQGHNLSSDASCSFAGPGSLNSTDPLLGPLADYGGPTPTMALLAGSPALDTADPAFCPPTDQRGRTRPYGAGCDIGAFESSAPFTVLGLVYGFTTPASGIQIASPSGSTAVPPGGQFAVHGLATGTHLLSISSPECVFVPRTRSVTVGPDVVDVSFVSYRSNALVIERFSGNAVRGVFAGEAGATYHVLSSTELSGFTPYSTNQTQPNGLFEFTEGTAGSPKRFFQVVRP